MKLDELHVNDDCSRAPRHCDAVSSRDIRIGRIQVDFPATARRQHDSIRTDRFYFSRFFIQNIDAKTAIFCCETELACGDQIDRHMILKQLNMRLPAELAQQSVLDLFSRHVPHMQHPTLRVAALLAEIEFAMARDLALIELQPKFHQLSD